MALNDIGLLGAYCRRSKPWWVIAFAFVMVLPGCISLPGNSNPNRCGGTQDIPFLRVLADSSIAVPPGNGTIYTVLGPDQSNLRYGPNGTVRSMDVRHAPSRCGAVLEIGPYALSGTTGWRTFISPNFGPFHLLMGCTGIMLAPRTNGTTSPSYVISPPNGSGDLMTAGHGGPSVAVNHTTLAPGKNLFLTLATKRCGGQNVSFLSVANMGSVELHQNVST